MERGEIMSRVFITGDTHNHHELNKIERFCKLAETTKDDFMVILGDYPFLFDDDSYYHDIRKRMEKMPISFILIRGNHNQRMPRPGENPHMQYIGIDNEICEGGFIHDERYPSLYHTAEFGFYILAGHYAFVISGAYSVDKYYRLWYNLPWFDNEQLSSEEMKTAKGYLKAYNKAGEPPIILSHTCPKKFMPVDKFLAGIDQSTVDNTMEEWLDTIEEEIPYERWYCGHYHVDRTLSDGRVKLMYENIIELERM